MNEDAAGQRLSRITTLWTLVEQAHARPPEGAADGAEEVSSAQRLLMERYRGAAYRYLLGAVRDQDAADELFQEFAVRFVRGDFRRADARRGRFRNYLKTALIHLLTDYHRARRSSPRPLPEGLARKEPGEAEATGPATLESAGDPRFERSWRQELVEHAWAELHKAHPPFHAVLHFHVENPEAHSPEIARRLSPELDRPLTPTNARVMLHRAREKFAQLLLEEVRRSLGSPTEEELTQELRELRLLTYCRPALERPRKPTPSAR